jgi:predicted house-cleaning noncanonical NTP pyrophosphatase (MazG superfamily)
MIFNKLVRDKILERIRAEDRTPAFHVADDAEYWVRLKDKLQEEVKEFLEAENVEELADVLEVLDAMRKFKGFDEMEVSRVKRNKTEERGGFVARIVLEEA